MHPGNSNYQCDVDLNIHAISSVTPHALRHTYAYMLRQARVSVEVRAEMSGYLNETAMKYGSLKAHEKERAAEALDEFANR